MRSAPSDLRRTWEALVSLNADLERDQGLALQIRTGINTGEGLAGDAASGQPFATGPAVTIAMRLQQEALPGETLVGEATRAVLHEAAALEPVEQIETDAPLGPIRAFRLLAVGDRAALRPQSSAAFVGRQEELAALRLVFDPLGHSDRAVWSRCSARQASARHA